ncbi:MAG: hypothetical protein ABW168_12200, partial [Sedimenticola sp.]
MTRNGYLYFAIMAILFLAVGLGQSWNLALSILILCLISAIMSLGVNIQWGYAGLFNVGIMGFAALGGLAAVLVSMPPVAEAWSVGGVGIGLALLALVATVVAVILVRRWVPGRWKLWATIASIGLGLVLIRSVYDPAVELIEAVNPA